MSSLLTVESLTGSLGVMDPAARITFFETLITNLEAAFLVLSTGRVASYTLNTGQTTETVTKRNLVDIRATLDWAYARLEFFLMRYEGGNTIVVR